MLTAIVIALNAERHIAECLATLPWADERVVLDGGSRDETPALARQAGARVYVRPFDTFARQRNYALALARTPWVFFVDADERVGEDLAAEVGAAIEGTSCAGFWVPRRNVILGAWVRRGGWYPDYQLRVLRRGYAHYDDARPVHEVPSVAGQTHYLRCELRHVNYEDVGQLWRKQWHYARYEAQALHLHGVRARPHRFVLQPAREFRRRLLTLEGWRDGWRGFLLATTLAAATFVTYGRLAILERRDAPRR